jgi:hypothetical protein
VLGSTMVATPIFLELEFFFSRNEELIPALHQLMHTAILLQSSEYSKDYNHIHLRKGERRKRSSLAIVSLITLGNAWLPHISNVLQATD